MAAAVTKGYCEFCGEAYSRRGIKRHLDSCSRRHIETAGNTPYYTLSIEGAYERDYWLYVEMAGGATLTDLDDFLRDIWLECCGHLSQFIIGNERFLCEGVESEWGELSMDVAFKDIAQPGLLLEYEYDFGSTTTLKLKVISARLGGSVYRDDIQLLARNIAPEIRCDFCDRKATRILTQDHTPLCDSCEKDGVEEYDLPIVNSPRTGVCAYGNW